MRLLRLLRAPALVLAVSLTACCTSEACLPENLPHQGVAKTSEELAHIVRHAVSHECWSTLYDYLSARTRAEHSYIKIRPFIASQRVEEPYGYLLLDILAKGEFLGVLDGGPKGGELIMLSYAEPGRPELLAQVLVVTDPIQDGGGPQKRLGLQEQFEDGPPVNQEAGDIGGGDEGEDAGGE